MQGVEMARKIMMVLSFLFLSIQLYGQKNCLEDKHCHEYYRCQLGICEIESFEDKDAVELTIKEGNREEKEIFRGNEIFENGKDVVLGAIMISSEDEGIFIPEVINFFLDKSENVEIRNMRLIHDINGNGKYDDFETVIMSEPESAYGPNTRFIEFEYGKSEVLYLPGDFNFLFVADIIVDENNTQCWPLFGKIKSISSMKFSDNSFVVKQDMIKFPSVGLMPPGRVLFFDTDSARMFVSYSGALLSGITIMSTEDTTLKTIRFSAEVEEESRGLFGVTTSTYPDDSLFYLKIDDSHGNERIYSTDTLDAKKTINTDFKLKAYKPVNIYIESDGFVCGDIYYFKFEWNAVSLSDPGFQSVNLPYSKQAGASGCAKESYGCSVSY
jgi:hypothetical protein